jgi:hypothetical protein
MRPIDRVTVVRSDPFLDQMASPESVFGKTSWPHWRRGDGHIGSPAGAQLATVEIIHTAAQAGETVIIVAAIAAAQRVLN